MKELLSWLRRQYRSTEKSKRIAIKRRNYGEALYLEGIAAAYAFTIIHVERSLRTKPVK